MSDGSRLARLIGVLGFATRRTAARMRGAERTQILLSIGGVAVAVSLLLLVTSVGVGLSASETVRASNADFAIIPAGGSSAVTDVGRARLGQSHRVAERLSARDDVVHATAIRTEFMRVRPAANASGPPIGESVDLLVVGASSTREDGVIAGLPTDALGRTDSHYANGTYNGTFTGEAVLSTAAAERLGATEGTVLQPQTRADTDRPFRTVAVREPTRAGVGQLPVALVHLSELQTVVGATGDDAADQLFVEAQSSAVRDDLARVYPETVVVSRDDLFASASGRSSLPVAIALAAFVVALVVGTLFMVTTMGFELAADREERAVMRAIGVSGASRAAIVVVQAFVVAIAGGIAGVALWLAGLGAANALAAEFAGAPVAAFRPVLAGYGIAVALLIGLLTVPYLLVAAWRSSLSGSLP
jgi:putative ABC transport system permease protein